MRGAVLLGFLILVGTIFVFFSPPPSSAMVNGDDLMNERPTGYPIADLAGGCFWCTESEFRALDGVLYTEVGYMGGDLENPTYRDITTGKTGHAEVTRVTFDPEKISFEELVRFFLTQAHDPTQLNRQGVDVGTQYRSAIFYHNDEQKKDAEGVIAQLERDGHFGKKIATTLEAAATFWEGEEYHQQYYEKYEVQTGKPHLRVILKQAKKKAKEATGL